MLAGVGAALIVAAALVVNVGAQDGVGGALATLAAATRQAEQQWQAGQAAAQAAQWRAAQAATATAQTQDAQALATRLALDDLAGQQAAAATATAGAYRAQASATAEAYQLQAAATATAYGIQAGATATALAQDAAATAAAYALVIQADREQTDLGYSVLHLAAAMTLLGMSWVILAWTRALAARLRSAAATPPAWGVVIDALPSPSARMPEQVRVVNDPDLGAKIEAWFYGSGEDGNF